MNNEKGSAKSSLFNIHSSLDTSGVVFCVPSGNFGNICSALFGHVMGLPVKRFIAANNANSVFYEYLQSGEYRPRPSVQTIANAMDVGDPSNFARILDLYSRQDVQEILRQRNIAQPLPPSREGSEVVLSYPVPPTPTSRLLRLCATATPARVISLTRTEPVAIVL